MCDLIDKKEQFKALNNGKGIQYLLNEAYKIMGNPILTHDMEYKIIAYTENIVSDDPIWNEFVTTGTVDRDRLEFYKQEKFFETAANATKITFLRSNKLKYDRIFGKLFNSENFQVGCASIEGAHQPFENDDPELFELFCDILNKEIGMSEYYQNYGQVYYETLINELITGELDKPLYTAHVESIYLNLESNLYLAVVDITNCGATPEKLVYFRDLFKRTQSAYKYSIYSNYIIVVLSTANETLDVKNDLNQLNRLFEQNNIYAGISSNFDNLFELQKYYREAVSALNNREKNNSSHRIFLYNDIFASTPDD